MGNEHGIWIMHGVGERDERRITSAQALMDYVDEAGFLPLFKNDVPGFSVEERTAPGDWWSGDARRDPWEWRIAAAASGRVAYGKFFDKKAGFISLRWLPYFANWRRGGYDFDSRWEEGLASYRAKRVMELFAGGAELFSYETKSLAGFGGDGERNFEGTVTLLQMQTYLVIRDFRCRVNRAGLPYGWPIAVYTAPESVWGYELLASAYSEEPEASRERVYERVRELYPGAAEQQIRRILK